MFDKWKKPEQIQQVFIWNVFMIRMFVWYTHKVIFHFNSIVAKQQRYFIVSWTQYA